jgi:MYXO-CTERM domain-containing protein
MSRRIGWTSFAVIATAFTGPTARADVPACPAWLGGYVATVDAGSVTVCPTTTAVPGYEGTTVCPFTTGMMRVDVNTGAGKLFQGPCVADPAANGNTDAGTPCFLDPCVPPGTYEYGYQIPKFAGCTNEACAGPTSGEWATVVTVSSSACAEDAGLVTPGFSPAIWRDVDAAVVDGAVVWSATCTGPLPGPDGGYCAWRWLDGSAQWAPCPADSGMLCEGFTADGSAVPVECPPELDAGGFGGISTPPANTSDDVDAGAMVPPRDAPAADNSHGSGGCSMSAGEDGTMATYGALATLSLGIAIGLRRSRRRRA